MRKYICILYIMPTRKQQYETYKSIIQNVDLIQTKYATIKSNIYLSKLKKLKRQMKIHNLQRCLT